MSWSVESNRWLRRTVDCSGGRAGRNSVGRPFAAPCSAEVIISAAFAVFLLLSLGGIGFVMWFFIALCKEARKRRVRSVRRTGLNLYKVRPTPCDPAP